MWAEWARDRCRRLGRRDRRRLEKINDWSQKERVGEHTKLHCPNPSACTNVEDVLRCWADRGEVQLPIERNAPHLMLHIF
jgi:hypothetical protein